MARVALQQAARDDLERLADFLAATDPAAALRAVTLIFEAIGLLEQHPLIGRTAEGDMRELVISRGRSGYVALYDYREPEDLIVVLRVRHQREAGFPEAS